MAYRDIILAETSLVSYWECQETSGTTLADSKGSNTATIQNASWVQLGRPGINGGYAVQFDGVNGGYALIGTPATALPSGNGKFTLEFWMWCANGASISNNGFFGMGNYGTNNQVRAIRLSSTTTLTIYHWANDYSAGVPSFYGKWSHVVVTYNQTNYRVYVDGALYSTSGTVSALNVQNTNVTLWKTQTTEYGPDANVCHMAVYNDALTLTQIQAHYAARTAPAYTTYADTVLANPRARHYWKLDEAAGATSFANQRGTQPLTVGSGGTVTAGIAPSSIDGGAVRYNAAGNYLEQVTREGMNKRQGWAVECWIRPVSFSANVRNYIFYDHGAMIGLGFSRDGTSSTNLCFTFDGINHYDTGYYLPPDDTWHHVVFSYHQWGAVQIFVDNVQIFYNFPYTQNYSGANLDFRIQTGGGTLVASIDEIVYYEEALPDSYRIDHYNLAKAQYPPGNARATQVVAEAVIANTALNALVSNVVAETVMRETTADLARVSNLLAEVVIRPASNALLTNAVAEIVTASKPPGPTKTTTSVVS
jgi:hypothetical protein